MGYIDIGRWTLGVAAAKSLPRVVFYRITGPLSADDDHQGGFGEVRIPHSSTYAAF